MKKSSRRFLLTLSVKLPLTFIFLSVMWVVVLRWVPVYVTPLMLKRAVEFRDDDTFRTRKEWCPIGEISPEMMKAVITSEDNLFAEHKGFSWSAIRLAMEERKEGGRHRGGSTISQQTAKNVFTFCGRSWWRKGWESYYTVLIEHIWGKERIMEVYLNVIEMGRGIYGAQAAAREHFGTDAAHLSRLQACTVAACLPNPLKRNAGRPSAYIKKRAATLSRRVPQINYPDWVNHRQPPRSKDV